MKFRFRFSPPPGVSGAQKQYEQERFRVQPGRIEDYSLGRGSLAQKEAQQVSFILFFSMFYPYCKLSPFAILFQ